MRSIKMACAAAMVGACSLASAAPWASFNGYFPGMSEDAAKALGVEGCRTGEGATERKDSLYCWIPSPKRQLGTLTATKALLELKGPKHRRVDEIHLEFLGSPQPVFAALQGAYGKPAREDANYWYWNRAGSETVTLYKGQRGAAFVNFTRRL
ncbi:MAG TPA: hypothetical protein VF169_19505 [Albitalea sp.]|uniref:hypothetical protein n=1 Tax=Piscinibacter sp. TaxID=1903157 RepID=UPI002ED0613A